MSLDERSWRIDSCPSTTKGLYQHYRRYKALAADLCSSSLIGENGFLRKDNVQIADKSGFIALRRDIFRLSGVPYCTIFRLRFPLQVVQGSYLIFTPGAASPSTVASVSFSLGPAARSIP